MARTKQEITEEIQKAFVSNPTLQQIYGLTGNNSFTDEFSLVSLEAQLIEVMSTEIKVLEDLQDVHTSEINKRIAELIPGTLFWYQNIALQFQIGHVLQWNTDKLRYEYAVADEISQIVKLCAVSESDGYLAMKLAKLDGNGMPEKLDASELLAFKTDYMERMKYAGVFINYISSDPDKIRLKLKVYYNPSVLAPDGSLLSDSTSFPINDAVDEYLKLMPFNGVFNVTDLTDRLQKVNGVINPLFISASAQFGAYPFEPVTDYYQSNAGYMIMDDVVPLDVEYVLL